MGDYFDDLEKELLAQLKSQERQAHALYASKVKKRIDQLARKEMNRSYDIWKSGLNIAHQSETETLIEVTGKLSEMFEHDGVPVGALRKMILEGNRADYNEATTGTRFVDVPIKEKRPLTQAEMVDDFQVKKFKFSDILNKGVREENREVARIYDKLTEKPTNSILSKQPDGSSMVIQFIRISENSDPNTFPSNQIQPKRILEKVESELDKIQEEVMKEVFGE